MRKGEMLLSMATDNWAEYFIGIGRDQSEVLKAKSRFAQLDPQNASAFWGDTEKLLPEIDGSIDNFFMVLPEHSAPIATADGKSSVRSMLMVISKKLARGGALWILTDLDGAPFKELVEIASQAGLKAFPSKGKEYFPKGWRDPEFRPNKNPQIFVLTPQ
jgi:tRNA G46 methylase TrmB